MTEIEMREFRAWKAESDRRARERGDFWLTPEGREKVRDTWDDPEDGNIVLPLLNALEAAEATIERLKAELDSRRR